MPAPHDLDPPSMTDEERRAKRVQDAAIGYELDRRNYFEQRDAAFDIVRRLAEESPNGGMDTWHWCSLCGVALPIRPTDHETDCPWRMAVEWVASTAPAPSP